MSDESPLQRKPRTSFDWSTAFIAIVVVAAAATVYWRDGQARFLQILTDDFYLFLDILPKVLPACLVAAFVAVVMRRDVVIRWVGAESGFTGILIATIAGAIVPGGPITVFPIAAAFVAVGADIGATIAFVTSWTLIGYGRVLVWELPFFGIDFVMWRTLVALPLPIVAGLLGRALSSLIPAKKGDGA